MSKPENNHLTQDQLMRAAFDESRLSQTAREHLANCSYCKEQKTKLYHRLGNLRSLSNRVSARSAPWYSITGSTISSATPRPFALRFMLIIGMVAAVIIILNLYDPFGLKSHDRKIQSDSIVSDVITTFDSIEPLPDIYAGILAVSDPHTPWWQKQRYVDGLKLTPEEIGELASIWDTTQMKQQHLLDALRNKQVNLAMSLEEKGWQPDTVQRHYQDTLERFTQLTQKRLEILVKIRMILGHQRFQTLLQLQN